MHCSLTSQMKWMFDCVVQMSKPVTGWSWEITDWETLLKISMFYMWSEPGFHLNVQHKNGTIGWEYSATLQMLPSFLFDLVQVNSSPERPQDWKHTCAYCLRYLHNVQTINITKVILLYSQHAQSKIKILAGQDHEEKLDPEKKDCGPSQSS